MATPMRRADHLPAHRLDHRAGNRPLLGEASRVPSEVATRRDNCPKLWASTPLMRRAKRERADRAAGGSGADAGDAVKGAILHQDRSAPSISARPNRA